MDIATSVHLADTVIFWESLTSDGPAAALARLRPGGTVIAVAPTLPAPRGPSATAMARILAARAPGREPVRVLDNILVIPGDAGMQRDTVIPNKHEITVIPNKHEITVIPSKQQSTVIPSERSESRNLAVAVQPRRKRTPPPTHRGRHRAEPSASPAAPSQPAMPSSSQPLVTAIVPVYNDAARVGRAIDSLRRQTWQNLEILVIDDGSTDDTAQAVAKHLTDPRVRYLYKPHSGRPETRNLGVAQARGDYVAWLGSDDESMPNRIAAQVAAVRADPSIDIVHSDGFFICHDGSFRETRRYEPFTPQEFPYRLFIGLARVCPILDTSALIRRSLYDRLGPYDLAFPRCQDYEFYLRAAMAGNVRCAHVPLALVRVHQGPPSKDRSRLVVDFYMVLARRMLEFFGPERLMAPLARDLHIDPRLTTAEVFAWTGIVFQAPPNHAVSREAEARLTEVAEKAAPADRIDAHKLLGLLALSYGDSSLATLCFGRARDVAAQAVFCEPAPEGQTVI